MRCSLCNKPTGVFYREEHRIFVDCKNCRGVMLLPEFYLTPGEKKERYQLHNNDVQDPEYRNFVNPIINAVKTNFPLTAIGLDYGCGTGPVAAVQLTELGDDVKIFDPFFENHPQNLKKKYDFIICCDVMEHFWNPKKEFNLLNSLLKPGGKLFCKTMVFYEEMDFPSWHYIDDPTHVFLYSPESLEWIRGNLRFGKLKVEPKLITFEK